MCVFREIWNSWCTDLCLVFFFVYTAFSETVFNIPVTYIRLFVGSVKDGQSWYSTQHYQSTTSELHATIALSFVDLDCPWNQVLIPTELVNSTEWDVIDGYVIKHRDDKKVAKLHHYSTATNDTLFCIQPDHTASPHETFQSQPDLNMFLTSG